MPQLARETVRSAQQPAVHHDRRTDTDLRRHVHEVARSTVAQPEFGERAEVGLVAHAQREVHGQQTAEVRVPPVEVRSTDDRARVPSHQTRHSDRQAGWPQPLVLGLGDDSAHQLAEFLDHRCGRPAPIRAVPHRPGPHHAAQIDRADGEMVDADLRPDSGRTVPADGQRRAGAAHPAGPLGTEFLQ